jgi:hypothetical protein
MIISYFKMVLIGNFARDMLNHSGTIQGKLHSLKSLQREGVGTQDEDPSDSQSYDTFLPAKSKFEVFELYCSSIYLHEGIYLTLGEATTGFSSRR